jgi:hypothetical protein
MAGARGIEVFGRGATVVEPRPRRRTAALGIGSVLLAVVAIAAVVGALAERTDRTGLAPALTWVALAVSAAAVLAGAVAVITGRGRRLGLLGGVLGALANPWLLSRLLEAAAALQG